MNKFLFVLYVSLYGFVGGALVTIDIVSIKAGWPWLSQLVKPMGIVFLCVNIPLAFFAVLKIGHVVFLHSLQHHQNVMRSIRAADEASLTHSTTIRQVNSVKDETLSQQSGSDGTPPLAIPKSQSIPTGTPAQDELLRNCNVVVARQLSLNSRLSMNQMIRATGYSRGTRGRTNAWKYRSR